MRKAQVIRFALCVLTLVALASFNAAAAQIHLAAKSGDITKVEALLKADPLVVNLREQASDAGARIDEWTPLHYAASAGKDRVASLLVSKGADVSARDRYGFTPLHYAASAETVKVLVNAGAKQLRSRSNGWTPLHRAVFNGNLEVARALADAGANVNARDRIEKTPLHYAAGWGKSTEIAAFLISRGAEVNELDEGGWTPLHNAAFAGNADMVRLLLDKGANPNAMDDFGHTALDQARAAGRSDVSTILTPLTRG